MEERGTLPRQRRGLPGCPHHIPQRGNNRRDVFFDDSDRQRYLCLLKEYTVQYQVDILGYSLMTHHVLADPPARKPVARCRVLDFGNAQGRTRGGLTAAAGAKHAVGGIAERIRSTSEIRFLSVRRPNGFAVLPTVRLPREQSKRWRFALNADLRHHPPGGRAVFASLTDANQAMAASMRTGCAGVCSAGRMRQPARPQGQIPVWTRAVKRNGRLFPGLSRIVLLPSVVTFTWGCTCHPWCASHSEAINFPAASINNS